MIDNTQKFMNLSTRISLECEIMSDFIDEDTLKLRIIQYLNECVDFAQENQYDGFDVDLGNSDDNNIVNKYKIIGIE